MKTYARIQDGHVVELLNTAADIKGIYHPSLIWIDASSVKGLSVGWAYDAGNFLCPEPLASTPAQPSLAELRAQLALLTQQIAALDRPM